MPLTERKNFTIPRGNSPAKYFIECYTTLQHYTTTEQFSMISIYADFCYNLLVMLEADVHLAMIRRARANGCFDQ